MNRPLVTHDLVVFERYKNHRLQVQKLPRLQQGDRVAAKLKHGRNSVLRGEYEKKRQNNSRLYCSKRNGIPGAKGAQIDCNKLHGFLIGVVCLCSKAGRQRCTKTIHDLMYNTWKTPSGYKHRPCVFHHAPHSAAMEICVNVNFCSINPPNFQTCFHSTSHSVTYPFKQACQC